MQKINQLREDIEVLNSKVDNYYLKYGELPILCDYVTKSTLTSMLQQISNGKNCSLNQELNSDDGDEYAVIDLERLDGLTLNYGYDKDGEYFTLKNNKVVSSNTETEIYVINTKTHQIYFPHGIFADKIMYYTF